MKSLALILAICFGSTAFAGSDEFRIGVLDLPWGSTLQKAQAAYPGGLVWPVNGSAGEGIVYAIPGNDRMLDLATSIKYVQFVFNGKNELQQVFFHFDYNDRDSALYDVGLLLGQGYSTKDEASVRKFNWKLGEQAKAQLEVGATAFQPWIYLAFQSTKFAAEPCTCRRQ